MSGKHLAVAAVKPDIAWGSCGLVTALPVDRKQASLALCYSLSVCPWSNINSAGSDRHTLSPPVSSALFVRVWNHAEPQLASAIEAVREITVMRAQKTHTRKTNPPTNRKGQTGIHTVHWLGGNECVPRLHSDAERGRRGGLYPDGLFFAPQQPAEMSPIRHSYLVAAASRAHPSPFPAPCRRPSSASSALINLITNHRIDPRPIYLSTYVCPGCLCACFGPRQPHPAESLNEYQMFFFLLLFTIYAQPSDITNKHANCHRHMFLFVVKCSLLVDSVDYK